MNSIPLIKGNTPQEINTSIIALKKALSELEAQDRLLQGADKDVQDKIKQINQLIEGINTHLGTVDTHLNTIDSQITALQPVDTVTSGNMQSVTSNAVYNAINSLNISKVERIRANIHNPFFNYFSDFSGVPFDRGVNGLLIIKQSEYQSPSFIGFITYKYQDNNTIYKLAGELTPYATNLIGTVDFQTDLLGWFAELIMF